MSVDTGIRTLALSKLGHPSPCSGVCVGLFKVRWQSLISARTSSGIDCIFPAWFSYGQAVDYPEIYPAAVNLVPKQVLQYLLTLFRNDGAAAIVAKHPNLDGADTAEIRRARLLLEVFYPGQLLFQNCAKMVFSRLNL